MIYKITAQFETAKISTAARMIQEAINVSLDGFNEPSMELITTVEIGNLTSENPLPEKYILDIEKIAEETLKKIPGFKKVQISQ